jgi:hypothetical protein
VPPSTSASGRRLPVTADQIRQLPVRQYMSEPIGTLNA